MRVLYKAVSALAGVAAGVVAGALFKRIWRLVGREAEPPEATDRDRSWVEVLAAAALQGATFGLVKAAVDRSAAKGFAGATGEWPTS